jgi:outer membrane biosynthesis protein TonB
LSTGVTPAKWRASTVVGITFEPFPSEHTMPIRIASLSRQLHKNGQRLHVAMMSRAFSHGTDPAPSEQEKALREERSALKAAQAERRASALLPKAKPVKVVKEAKPAKAPKAPKAAKPPKEKAAKSANKPSRADKQTKKAENLEAAKKADRKSAKT